MSSRSRETRPGGYRLEKFSPFFVENKREKATGNKRRGIQIARGLIGELFDRLDAATKKQHREHGVDFYGIVKRDPDYEFSQEYRMPFQIVSSGNGARDRYRSMVPGDPKVVVVVNDFIPDEHIREMILQKTVSHLIDQRTT